MAVSGQPPYGFEWNGGELAVNRPEAVIRLRMFELFIGHGKRGVVARLLNEEGSRTRRKSKWSDNAVTRHLKCPSAIGLYPINKTTKNSAGDRVTKPENEWDYLQCPEIIPRSLWEDAQRLLGSGIAPTVRTVVHLFSGLAFCECGEKMRVPSNTPRYVCSACKNKIPIENLDALFRDRLMAFIDSRSSSLESDGSLIFGEEAEIIELESRIAKTEELFVAGKIDAKQFGDKCSPIKTKIDRLKRELAKRANLQVDVDPSEQNSKSLNKTLIDRWDVLRSEHRRRIVEKFVDKLIVGTADVVFHMRLSKSPKELTTSRQTDSPTNTPSSADEEELKYIRLPKAGERCPLSSYTRSSLNNLILPCAYNNFTPLVESISKRMPGKKRGIRLIVWSSLKAYLDRQTE